MNIHTEDIWRGANKGHIIYLGSYIYHFRDVDFRHALFMFARSERSNLGREHLDFGRAAFPAYKKAAEVFESVVHYFQLAHDDQDIYSA